MSDLRVYIDDPFMRERIKGNDVVNEHIEQKYKQAVAIPLDKLTGEYAVPRSYTEPTRNIMRALTGNVISSGTGEMLVDAVTDLTVGGNLNIHNITDDAKEKELNSTIDKAVRSAELFGNTIVVVSDSNMEIYDATQYYKEEDTIDIVFPTIYNRKDEYMRIRMKHVDDNTYITTESEIIGQDDALTVGKEVTVIEFTNNRINHDKVGESTLLPVLNDIISIDMTIHQLEKTMYYTKPRVHMSSELVELDENGEPVTNNTDDVYVNVDALGLPENANPYQVTQFEFQQKEYDEKIKNALSRCLSKIGLDNRILAYGNGNIERTATEIRSSDDRMINTIERKRNQYYNSIRDLIETTGVDVKFNFTPTTYVSFDQMVTSVVTLKQTNMISSEVMLKLLYPRWSETEIQDELTKLESIERTKDEQTNTG